MKLEDILPRCGMSIVRGACCICEWESDFAVIHEEMCVCFYWNYDYGNGETNVCIRHWDEIGKLMKEKCNGFDVEK